MGITCCNHHEQEYEQLPINIIDLTSNGNINTLHATDSTIEEFELNNELAFDLNFNSIISKLEKNTMTTTSLLSDKKYMREEEMDIIDFTIFNTIELYKQFLDNFPKMTELYNKKNDPLYAKWNIKGWKLNQDICIGFHRYLMDITSLSNITIEVINNLLNLPEYTVKWDKNVKSHKMLFKKNHMTVFHKSFKSPIPIVSERERVDKQVLFEVNKRIFSITTAVSNDEEICELDKTLVRMKNYLALFTFYIREYKNQRYIVFYSLNQIDARMYLPEFIYYITVPIQTKAWYSLLYKALEIYDRNGYDGINNMNIK